MKNNFNKTPIVKVPGREKEIFSGWSNICDEILKKIIDLDKRKTIIVVETYQGVHHNEILESLKRQISFNHVFVALDAMLNETDILNLTYPDITDDRIFGFLTHLNLSEFFDKKKLESTTTAIHNIQQGTILVYGCGAALLCPEPDMIIYADMARREIELRMTNNEVNNIGIYNTEETYETKYKRGYFVDWRVCDRLKKKLMHKWNYVLDTHIKDSPKMATAAAIKQGLDQTINTPFSVVPYFDPGIWGGQWMKDVCDLDKETENFAWCFNCVPEENSLFLSFGDEYIEIPSINLVFLHPAKLLGDAVHARFGDEFPIRFDFLDTMQGGNLSLQVHPLTEYIQEKFGIHYTQDESYYLLDAEEDACVYLGLKNNVDSSQMIEELKETQKGGVFNAEKYVNKWPAKKHDHFLIPAGTIHCSGKNSMVLEISSTPYIFTFKLWDWGRVGLDGIPRPINIEHGKNVIQWNRTTKWVENNLINQVEKVAEGDGWKEEKTGLHKREFIETRRHWFTKKVLHKTNGSVNVLNLIEGREVIVESPTGAFSPIVIHYAETFIVPASVEEYTIQPYGESEGKECATIKAHIRF